MKRLDENTGASVSVNMTPIIDIVFLLIIFFMLVCQYIVAESFEVDVPDRIHAAEPADLRRAKATTVTVMQGDDGRIAYAVGAEIIPDVGSAQVADAVARAIDRQLGELPIEQRRVIFRNDKDIVFAHTKAALLGISLSSAVEVKWAVMREEMDR